MGAHDTSCRRAVLGIGLQRHNLRAAGILNSSDGVYLHRCIHDMSRQHSHALFIKMSSRGVLAPLQL
jgi:hypothetical protein